jgi:hypothetical protein
VRQLGAVDLLQVVQDVPHGHAVRVQADDHVIQAAGHPPGPLGHQQRTRTSRPCPGARPGPPARRRSAPSWRWCRCGSSTPRRRGRPARPCHSPGAVPARPGPRWHRLDQLAEHRPLTGQPQPARLVPRPVQQRVQQPVIHQLPQRHPRRRAARRRPARARPVTGGIPGRRQHRAAACRSIRSRDCPVHRTDHRSPQRHRVPLPARPDHPELLLYTPRVIPSRTPS